MIRWLLLTIACLAIPLILGGCQREEKTTQPEGEKPAATQTDTGKPAGTADTAIQAAVAELRPTTGNQAAGKATFTRTAEGVEVVVEMQGLMPGKHGIHVHEKGDCSAPDASSAGGHFAPDGAPHGGPDNPAGQRHAGDLGNIEATPDGTANYRRVDQIIQLEGPNSVIGKAILVHAGADDLTSQPTGDSGARVACGIIEKK
jgi:Cu-Zn family superoxide dismutase